MKVVQNNRITSAEWYQQTHHVTLAWEEGENTGCDTVSYHPGDVILIYPKNQLSFVTKAIELYQNEYPDANTSIDITRVMDGSVACRTTRLSHNITCTIFELFSTILDISGIPTRNYFEMLSFFAEDDEEKEKLLEISSSQGVDLYLSYCAREKRNYIEVLSEFKSCHVPLNRLIELIPLLSPRQYSIASSQLISGNKVNTITVIPVSH
jgi:sulfite reductase alpha subunit-like flavoprotein